MSDLLELVHRSLSEATAEEFLQRVESQAGELEEALGDGELDNTDYAIGMEMEVYAVDSEALETKEDAEQPSLVRLPESVFDSGATKELGLHNAEINTDPDICSGEGFASQASALQAQFEQAQSAARKQGCELVLDAMWTLPPTEGSTEYLSAVESRDDITIADNMRTDSRYIAIDNDALEHAGGSIPFSVPGTDLEFPTILFESLATSIQPHLQIPNSEDFPAYYNAGIRTLGPLLAISTNSPFLPPDLYSQGDEPDSLVEESHHELRIAVFEQSVNQSPNDKVRVPVDLETVSETVWNVLSDDLYAPFLREWLDDTPRESFGEQYWEFDYKRSTYWRWLRCVIGGDVVEGDNDERSVRIEYRPIPTQPTIQDVIGMQALTVGLLRGLVARDHPLVELSWTDAERSFYAAAEEGLHGDLVWLTSDGERTTDTETIYAEVFEYAREGLREADVSEDAIEEYLQPIQARWEQEMTPSMWKKAKVRDGLDDGLSFSDSVLAMQREYLERSRSSDSFAEWL